MRKISIIFAILLFCFMPNAYTIEAIDEGQGVSALPFNRGEKLTYEVRYNNVKTGKSVLTFHGQEDLDNRRVYHITFFTRLTAFTDNEELYADKSTFLPIEVHRTLKTFGAFTTKIKEIYNQKDCRVDIEKKSRFRKEEFFIEKDSPLHNAILLTYYCRTLVNFDKTDKIKISLPTVDFEVIYKGEETIETPLGEFLAHVFTGEPSKFRLWLSVDKRRTPLKIENPVTKGHSLVIKSID